MAVCLLNFPNKFVTSDITKYLRFEKEITLKKSLVELKIQVSSCSVEKPDTVSQAVCTVL